MSKGPPLAPLSEEEYLRRLDALRVSGKRATFENIDPEGYRSATSWRRGFTWLLRWVGTDPLAPRAPSTKREAP